MKTSAIFLAVASVIAGVIAAPQPAPAPPALAANEIQATLRTDGNTTYTASSDFSVLAVRTSRQCSARNFGGTCYRFTFDSGVCWSYSDFGSTVYNALNDKTSSIDNFGATCTFYHLSSAQNAVAAQKWV
ncbi:hypothetical protein M7I_6665 [Glarea lozoyensis 74030]|uniref:Apple domain-containing protein n=1 Tax=Glarea lozoyensis (strain ATCC 74030 / MF5533) TaxID=1104152 RepID=H0EV71_GLAL7|nr:hypothetical protein M7I_6665 [Glarea lozoyensis 74030]